MTLRNSRLEWEQQKDLVEIAKETLQLEQQKATLHSSLSELYEKCDKLHASLLFQPSWRMFLKDLCFKICALPSSSKGGWMDFAAYLGFDKDYISSVMYRNINIPMDNAYIILYEFAKGNAATIDKIFKALYKQERYDIIDTMYSQVIDLCNAASMNQSCGLDGGYSSEENEVRTAVQPVKSKEVACNPLDMVLTCKVQSRSIDLIDGCFQTMQETFVMNQTGSKKAFSKTVMLTFAEDGETTATEVAFALRDSKQHRSIGVVILSENKSLITDDPCIKITDCFNQVDFVISIVTKKYLDLVFSSRSGEADRSSVPSPAVEPDIYYAPLIFRLMSTEYTRRHCLNSRFRSVIPNDQKDILFTDNPGMNVPFLSQWCLSKDAIKSPRKALLLRKKKFL